MRVRIPSRALAALVILNLAACSGGSSSSSGGGAAPASTVAPGSTANVGPLTAKAEQFEEQMARLHRPNGLVFNVFTDGNGGFDRAAGGGDSTIWTGAFVASQVWRYRETNDPAALANIESALWAIHSCHEITGVPGFFCRAWGDPAWFSAGSHTTPANHPAYAGMVFHGGTTSRDQYTGIFLAYMLAWPHIQDANLKAAMQDDCRAVARHLMANDLALKTMINGTLETHFRVDPSHAYLDNITAQSWNTVDDFPLNVIAQSIPYDQDLADALKAVQVPPVRGGEALRGLAFFSVCANIAGDPDIVDYYRNELIANRHFDEIARDTGTFVDDLLTGKKRTMIRQIVADVMASFSDAITVYLGKKWGNPLLAQILNPVLASLLSSVGDELGLQLSRLTTWLNDPSHMNDVNKYAQNATLLADILDLVGLHSYADSLRNIAAPASAYSSVPFEKASDALRSYVGQNLGHMSYVMILEAESDPAVRANILDAMEQNWEYIKDEQNAWFNYVHSGYGTTPVTSDVMDGYQALFDHTADLTEREIDNSNFPGLQLNPWPDRFGRTGNLALEPFPVSHREVHNFVWQEHPATIKAGSNSPFIKRSPTGYLIAYWLGRNKNFLTDQD